MVTELFNILLPPDRYSRKIGLYFGSFNPVHIGHMAIASYMVEYTDINQLWFVVSPQNPLKNNETLLRDTDRLELMHLAVGDDHRFRVIDVEFRLPKPSYTIDTLAWLTQKYPDHHFSIIIGSDNLTTLPQWKEYETILRNFPFLVYPRPGFPIPISEGTPNITIAEAPHLDISSTFIREAILLGKNMNHLVPERVWKQIEKKGFYR